MSTATRLGLLVAVIALTLPGCGSKPPKAELLSWRTTTVRAGEGGKIKGGKTAVVVTLRATGHKLYIPSGGSTDMYEMNCEDFTLSTHDGQTVKAVGHRKPENKGKDYVTSTYRDRPTGEEEIVVLFVVDEKLAGRSDLVLHYHELPPVPLAAEKKETGAASP